MKAFILLPIIAILIWSKEVRAAEWVRLKPDAILSVENFLKLKASILRDGDRQTYCNMYNNNPHLSVDDLELYLNPDFGQQNFNCDITRSDFNELVIMFRRSDNGAISYCHIQYHPLSELEYLKDTGDRPCSMSKISSLFKRLIPIINSREQQDNKAEERRLEATRSK